MKKIMVVLLFLLVAGCASLDSGMVVRKRDSGCYLAVDIVRFNGARGYVDRDSIIIPCGQYEEYKNIYIGDFIAVKKINKDLYLIKKIDSEAERKRITHGIE
jgi:hypothetical protein